jgi:hypothetical protein
LEKAAMRRHELDWLRVIVFGLLILYHVGMFFVPWGWHIKNDTIYPWVRFPMLFLNQWRLPLLFLISGMGTYFALLARSRQQFAGERFRRLLLPLLFGILVIVPPQVYLERLDKGQFSGGYLSYWPGHAFSGVYPKGNFSWHHLWFLPYLLLYSLALLPLLFRLRHHPGARLNRMFRGISSSPWKIYLLVLPLYCWEAFLEPFFPITHALWGDWFNLVNMGTFFVYGFILLSSGGQFWNMVRAHRRTFLLMGIACFLCFLFFRYGVEDTTLVHYTEAIVKVVNLWSWILAALGYASTYLHKPSRLLAYANEAVYPFYILHQTIIIILGYLLMHNPMGLLPKFFLMAAGTFLTTWILCEFLIRRAKWIRPLFGLKTGSVPGPA